jgi:hypothetical protein
MTEQIITIEKVENKLKKADNALFLKVNGKYSCFEESMFEKLRKGIGKTFKMEIAESNGFFNIRGVGNETEGNSIEVVKMNTPQKSDNNSPKEFHLSIEQQRIEALKMTLKYGSELSGDDQLTLRNELFTYINTGK